MSLRHLSLFCLLGCLATGTAWPQNYPVKPIRIIVPLAAGGPVDAVTRILAAGLTERFNQQIVVDNRPGAGGSVGAELVARATADGYTLLMAANGTLAIAPNLLKLPYDAARDLAPITLVGTSPQVLVVHPSLPTKSVKELVALAKSRPGMINFASSGLGSTSHLACELFKVTAKIDIVHIPYKGAGPALIDLAGGQTQMMITGVSTTLPYIKTGRLRALGVTSNRRVEVLPDTPPIADSLPDFEVTTWYGLLATAGTPASAIKRVQQETARALDNPSLKSKMSGLGVDAETNTPEQFSAMIQEETAKWARVIKMVGIKAQ